MQEAAWTAVNTVSEFLESYGDSIDLILWVLFDEVTKQAYDKVLSTLNESVT